MLRLIPEINSSVLDELGLDECEYAKLLELELSVHSVLVTCGGYARFMSPARNSLTKDTLTGAIDPSLSTVRSTILKTLSPALCLIAAMRGVRYAPRASLLEDPRMFVETVQLNCGDS